MSLLQNLASDQSVEDETDSIGNSGPLDSGAYASTVSMAYLEKAAGGALALVLHLDTDSQRSLRTKLWVTSGDAKGNNNFYTTKAGEKRYLPGFNIANSLCLLTVGKELSAMETEEKVIAIYNFEAKAEVPTKVPVLVALLGQELVAGVMRQTVDRNEKGDDGKYHPTGETRDENEIDKIFRARDKLTTAEIRGGLTEAFFYGTWVKKWAGVTRDKSSKTAGKAKSAGSSGSTAAKPSKSLFA
jgi:hypothetical protein